MKTRRTFKDKPRPKIIEVLQRELADSSLSQSAIARELGICQSKVSRILNGKQDPSWEDVEAMRKAIRVLGAQPEKVRA